MLPAGGVLEQARRARDPRFDGRFFIGVRTTGIYCRPVCPVKMPHAENVTFFASAAAAAEAGYRPCLRCRPESSPGTPAWQGTSTTVRRALRLIEEGVLDRDSVVSLSDRLGVTSRHLNRLFRTHLGASPKTVAQTRRLHFAKRLIDETRLPMTEIALSAGYGSIRRFNDHFRQTYGRSPSELRTGTSKGIASGVPTAVDPLVLQLSYRAPCDFPALLDFYRVRATPGVEAVGETYRRNFLLDGGSGSIEVVDAGDAITCRIEGGSPQTLMDIVRRVRRMFDTDAVPEEVHAVLGKDPVMAGLVAPAPGLRLPGAFEPFETAVRAIVGQQVSVKGATTIMGRIVERYGRQTPHWAVFPGPAELAELAPDSLPMPSRRAMAIKALAAGVQRGDVSLDQADDDALRQSLLAIPGIGPWTADYIALRVRADPDAFLVGDLVVRRMMETLYGITSERDMLAIAEHWRPWRGYAGLYLWRHAARLSEMS